LRNHSGREQNEAKSMDAIIIRFENFTVTECGGAMIIPERAIIEAGCIRTMTTNSRAHSKYEFHAMAQIALSRFQDGDLVVEAVQGTLTVEWRNEVEKITAGLVVFLDLEGNLHLIGHSSLNAHKLLSAACRFCTRWVRLDI
jgi:hypothetical protein